MIKNVVKACLTATTCDVTLFCRRAIITNAYINEGGVINVK